MSNPSWIERLLAGDPEVRAAALRAEIEEEIADHLAAAAGRYTAEGNPTDAARAKAQADFGDASRVVGQCLWIQLGDQVMLRSFSLAVGIALCSIGCLLVYSSVRTQREVVTGFNELSSQLARLNEREPVAAPIPRRPELHGHLYLGDPSRPAAGAYAEIRRLPEGDTYRVVFADEAGRFTVKHIPEGEYSVLAPQVGTRNRLVNVSGIKDRQLPLHQIQSQPFVMMPGETDVAIGLDIAFRRSELFIELSGSVVEEVRDTDKAYGADLFIKDRLELLVFHENLPHLPWNPNKPPPRDWPARGVMEPFMFPEYFSVPRRSFSAAEPLEFEFPARSWPLAPGDYHFGARLLIDVLRRDGTPLNVSSSGFGVKTPKIEDGMNAKLIQLLHQGGAISATTSQANFRDFDIEKQVTISLAAGMRTRVRLRVPPNRREQLAQVIFGESSTDEQILATCQPVNLEFEVVGQEPLADE